MQATNQIIAQVNGEEKRMQILITLTEKDLALLDEMAQGNRSEGVHHALQAWRAQVAELKRIKARMAADPTSVVSYEELLHRLAEKKATLAHVAA